MAVAKMEENTQRVESKPKQPKLTVNSSTVHLCMHMIVHSCCTQYSTEQKFRQLSLLFPGQSPLPVRWLLEGREILPTALFYRAPMSA